LAVRRSFAGRLASAKSACCTASTNGANLPGTSGRLYFGASALPRRSYLRTVFLAGPVALTISCTDFFSRCRIRKTLPIIAMVITPHTPPRCG
jgi:hypothetical protein